MEIARLYIYICICSITTTNGWFVTRWSWSRWRQWWQRWRCDRDVAHNTGSADACTKKRHERPHEHPWFALTAPRSWKCQTTTTLARFTVVPAAAAVARVGVWHNTTAVGDFKARWFLAWDSRHYYRIEFLHWEFSVPTKISFLVSLFLSSFCLSLSLFLSLCISISRVRPKVIQISN